MTHICVGNLTIIGSDNGLAPGRRQAIIWTNAGILLIGSLGTNFSEILIEILKFSFKKMHLKISSAKWRPFCLGLNVLRLGHGWVTPGLLWIQLVIRTQNPFGLVNLRKSKSLKSLTFLLPVWYRYFWGSENFSITQKGFSQEFSKLKTWCSMHRLLARRFYSIPVKYCNKCKHINPQMSLL